MIARKQKHFFLVNYFTNSINSYDRYALLTSLLFKSFSLKMNIYPLLSSGIFNCTEAKISKLVTSVSQFSPSGDLLIFIILDPNFSEGNKIGTLGSKDLIFFVEITIMFIGGVSQLKFSPY